MATKEAVSKEQEDQLAHEAAIDVIKGDAEFQDYEMKVGEFDVVVTELSTADFLLIGDVVMGNAKELGEAGLLKEKAWGWLDSEDWAMGITSISGAWKVIPEGLPKLLCMMAGVPEAKKSEFMKALKFRRHLPVLLREWMRRNPWKDIAEDFFQVVVDFREGVTEIKEADPGRASTSSPSSSSSQEPATD